MAEEHEHQEGPSWLQVSNWLLGIVGTLVIALVSWHWGEVQSLRTDLDAQRDSNRAIHQEESMDRAVIREQLRHIVQDAEDAKAWRQSLDSRINELLMRQSMGRPLMRDEWPKFSRDSQFSATKKERP